MQMGKRFGVMYWDAIVVNPLSGTLHLWCKREEIAKPISFNCTRHTFATLCLSAGMPLKVVSDYLGHKLTYPLAFPVFRSLREGLSVTVTTWR